MAGDSHFMSVVHESLEDELYVYELGKSHGSGHSSSTPTFLVIWRPVDAELDQVILSYICLLDQNQGGRTDYSG